MKLYNFQLEATNKFFKSGSLLVAINTGGGKTVVALNIMLKIKEKNNNKLKCIVIGPANLRSNFIDSIRKFKIKLKSIPITDINTFKENFDKYDIFIISYNFLRSYQDILFDYKWDLVVTDELHYAKNMATKNFKSLFELRKHTKHFLGLTASPISNDAREFFTIISIVANDINIYREGMKLIKYEYVGSKKYPWWQKVIFKKKDKKGVPVQIGITDVERFKQLVGKWIYLPKIDKIRKETGKVPEIKSFSINCYLTNNEIDAYKYAESKIPPEILNRMKNDNATEEDLRKIKNRLMACQQTLLSPDYIYNIENNIHNKITTGTKIKKAAQIIHKTGFKTIVYSTFKTYGTSLANHYFNSIGIKSMEYSGDIKSDERAQIVHRFENDDLQVICLTAAGQEGLNLPSCKNVIFLNLPWNGETLRQVLGRALRITSDNEFVNLIWLKSVYKDNGELHETVDLYISDIIQRKDIIRNVIHSVLSETMVSSGLPSYEGPSPEKKNKPKVLPTIYPEDL